MKKLISFGDSFTWGTDLSDAMTGMTSDPTNLEIYKKHHHKTVKIGPYSEVDHNHKVTTWTAGYSQHTWPALFAKHNNIKYVCYAQAGCSNQGIVRQFFQYLPYIDSDDLVIVNWTWIDRWDFYKDSLEVSEQWVTARPTNALDNEYSKVYYKYMQHEVWDKLETLKSIMLILNTLKQKNIKFLMTAIDTLTFDKTCHSPSYIANLQNEIINDIAFFEGTGFYTWSKTNNFPISDVGGHPLEEAHSQAFKYLSNNYEFT